jgi:hypothetical protein
MTQSPFSYIDTFKKEHVRLILEKNHYQSKDEKGANVYEHLNFYLIITYSPTHKIGGTNTSIVQSSNGYLF